VVFLRHVQTVPHVDATHDVLIGQRLFELDAKDKEPLELVKNVPYVSRVVVTNISNAPKVLKLMTQVPEGSMPLDGQASQVRVFVALRRFRPL
jgi:hypothetical protein